MRNRLRHADGQALVEFAVVLPLLLVLVLGVVEVGYALLDQHVVTKLSREGSNLISRDVTLQDAGAAMKSMKTRPVDFDVQSRLIFSVVKKVATAG
jgi:Flp pilus assembly protein TadG